MKKKFKKAVSGLIKINASPSAIALGVAIGVFISTIPIYGFHTLTVVIAAILVPPANKIAILLGTNFSLPFTLPIITLAGYKIGTFILRGNYTPLSLAYFKDFSLEKLKAIYWPLFAGSVVLGLICAVITYFITFFIARWFLKRHQDGRKP